MINSEGKIEIMDGIVSSNKIYFDNWSETHITITDSKGNVIEQSQITKKHDKTRKFFTNFNISCILEEVKNNPKGIIISNKDKDIDDSNNEKIWYIIKILEDWGNVAKLDWNLMNYLVDHLYKNINNLLNDWSIKDWENLVKPNEKSLVLPKKMMVDDDNWIEKWIYEINHMEEDRRSWWKIKITDSLSLDIKWNYFFYKVDLLRHLRKIINSQ